MQQRGADDLLRRVEGPDLQRAAGALAVPLPDQRGEGQDAEGGLHEQGEGAEEPAFAVVLVFGALS